MVFPLRTKFNELIISYDINWEDQEKIENIIMSEQRPSLFPPNSLKIASSGDLWIRIVKLWEKMNTIGHSVKAPDTATKASGQKRSVQPSDPPDESETNRWQVTDSPIASQSSEPSQQSSIPTQVSEHLPSQQLAEGEAYARKYYSRVMMEPPFVLRKRGKERERIVVIPSAAGLRPEFPAKAKIMLKDWDNRWSFWTLELGDTKYIVKAFPGASKGGVQYKRWTGPSEFEDDQWKGPVAFSDLKSASNPVVAVDERDGEEKLPVDSLESNDLYSVSDSESTASDTGTEGGTSPLGIRRSSTEKSRPARPETKSRVELGAVRRSSCKGDQPSIAPNTVKSARTSAPLPPQAVDGQRNKREHPITPPESTKRRRNEIRSTPPYAQTEERASIPRPCQISIFKQEHTTLRFYLKGSSRFHGERLRDCLTAHKLFGCITNYFNIASEDDAEVTVVFSWMEEGAEGREMAMHFGKEVDMEFLIEEVDNASVWDVDRGTGRCIVNVHVCRVESLVSRTTSVSSHTAYTVDE